MHDFNAFKNCATWNQSFHVMIYILLGVNSHWTSDAVTNITQTGTYHLLNDVTFCCDFHAFKNCPVFLPLPHDFLLSLVMCRVVKQDRRASWLRRRSCSSHCCRKSTIRSICAQSRNSFRRVQNFSRCSRRSTENPWLRSWPRQFRRTSPGKLLWHNVAE